MTTVTVESPDITTITVTNPGNGITVSSGELVTPVVAEVAQAISVSQKENAINVELSNLSLVLADHLAGTTVQVNTINTLSLDFTIDDWVLEGSRYVINITHNWGTTSVMASVLTEGSEKVNLEKIQNTDVNTTSLYITATPDLRFAGTVLLLSIPG